MQNAANNRDRFRGQELAGQLHKNYDLVALEKMITQLADQASGTTTAQSILAASYNLKFGDLYELKNISLQMIQTFKTALLAVAIWHQQEWVRLNGDAPMPASEQRALRDKA